MTRRLRGPSLGETPAAPIVNDVVDDAAPAEPTLFNLRSHSKDPIVVVLQSGEQTIIPPHGRLRGVVPQMPVPSLITVTPVRRFP